MPPADARTTEDNDEERASARRRRRDVADAVLRAWVARRGRWELYARRITRNGADAEDAVQDAVARTLSADPDLEDETQANRYVLSAVRTSALGVIDKRRRYASTDVEAIEGSHDHRTAQSLMEAEERRQQLRELKKKSLECLAQLKPEEREAIEMLVMREPPLKIREAAEIQGVPISTVYSRMRQGIRKIGERIAAAPRDEKVERNDE